ncbi:MAG: hypothetical protein JSW39_29145 [Desulfobacterales bacterium]|nr:MAG: hypothetical protein JSW39_29145 [Desulfobacterales bacterium]
MKRMAVHVLWGLVFLATLAGPDPGRADVPKFEEQLVYRLNNFDGKGYRDKFVPRSEDTIYLLADVNNAVSLRYTQVYYWPLTRKYLAAFKRLNEEAEGILEVIKRGDILKSLAKEEYVLFYPEGIMGEVSRMYVGAEAYAVFRKYEKPLTDFYQKMDAYNKEMLAYRTRIIEYGQELEARKNAGEKFDPAQVQAEMPQQPQPPARLSFDVTGLKQDFIISLPPGNYAVRLRAADGTIVEGSEKKLVLFTRRRQGRIGYEIIPGNRWTKREQSNEPSSTIYAAGRNTLYFRPYREDEYRELYYRKLLDPQNDGSRDRWIWVHTEPLAEVQLFLQEAGRPATRIERTAYRVKQTPGAELGYEIIPYQNTGDPAEGPPAFEGHPVSFSAANGKASKTLWLEEEAGRVLEDSLRRIVAVKREMGYLLYLISVFPLIAGLILFIRRKQSTS